MSHKKKDGENNQQWLNRVSHPSQTYGKMVKRIKRRKRFKLFYGIKNWFILSYLDFKDERDERMFKRVLSIFKRYYEDVIRGKREIKPICSLNRWVLIKKMVTAKEHRRFLNYIYNEKPSKFSNENFYEGEIPGGYWFDRTDPHIRLKFIEHLLKELN